MAKYPRKNTLKKSKVKKATSMVSKAYVKQYVKKTIHREAENKEIIYYSSNVDLTSAESFSTPRAPFSRRLIPSIQQQLEQNGRVGNVVTIRSANIKGYINVKPYDGVNNSHPGPILVKIWLVSCVSNNFVDMADPSNYAEFFETGSATAGFQNTPIDLCLTPNKALWRVHKTSRFKIGYGSNSTPFGAQNIYFDNSPMSHYFNFNYTKYCKKKIVFDDNYTQASNQNLYMVVQCVAADGSSVNIHPAEIHYVIDVQYEDL